MRISYRSLFGIHRSSPRARGFTLVELLVVITIIGMLMAMLFPAAGQVRDTVRMTTCQSNLKNIALAIKNYQSMNDYALPCGIPSCVKEDKQWITGGSKAGAICVGPNWASLILTQLGEGLRADAVNRCMQGKDCGNVCESVPKVDASVFGATPGVFVCAAAPAMSPNERLDGDMEGAWGLNNLSKGNYAACFGSGDFEDAITRNPGNPTELSDKQKRRGVFTVVKVSRPGIDNFRATSATDERVQGGWKTGRGAGVRRIGDGLTRTLMVSEVIGYDSARDGRGVWANGSMGASIFTAKTTPNADGTISKENMDHIPICDESIPANDSFKLKCVKRRALEAGKAKFWAAARSGHSGGVNVVYCDQHAAFITDQIDSSVWQAIATANGGETLSAE
jgi:prepilin-type N-terminal cleavage/methylation domain-containing protein/prepilin-type processing-associated H-X9-DG protein